jgi:hypothetical protein
MPSESYLAATCLLVREPEVKPPYLPDVWPQNVIHRIRSRKLSSEFHIFEQTVEDED